MHKKAKQGDEKRQAREQVGENRTGAGEDPAEGGEGTPTGRALEAPQCPTPRSRPGGGRREEEQLGQKAVRQEP